MAAGNWREEGEGGTAAGNWREEGEGVAAGNWREEGGGGGQQVGSRHCTRAQGWEGFVLLRLPGSHNSSVLPPDLRIYCIDDSAPMRRWLEHCFSGFGAVAVFGEQLADVERFVAAALADGDIVVCDQNLEYEGGAVLGTDLVHRLVADGFRGLLCIHSANDAKEDVAHYLASGAHVTVGKGTPPKEMVKALKQGFLTHVGPRKRESLVSVLSSCSSADRDA